jgi:site-specific DNA-methyltransferase (adenine-specific)
LTTFRGRKKLGLWSHYKRIIKDDGCIALFAQAPFDVELSESNKKWYRYEWIIKKTRPTGHLNARKAPMKAHEKILIFYKKPPTYNPQMTEGHPPAHTWAKAERGKTNYKQTHASSGGGSTQRFPTDVLTFKWDTQTDARHPNQKPISVCEYYIRTYTNAGDTVLDNCMGSGSTGVACVNTERNFIGIEKNEHIFIDATMRIEDAINKKKEGDASDVEEHQTIVQSTIEGF